MDQNLIVHIKEAREHIEQRGKAILVLLSLAENGRALRARKVIHLVQGFEATDTGLTAQVASEDRKTLYQVTIPIHRRIGGQEICRGGTCTCRDAGRAGSCKHVLAVANHWIAVYREDWNRLKRAEAALTQLPTGTEA